MIRVDRPVAGVGESCCHSFPRIRATIERVIRAASPALRELALSLVCISVSAPFARDGITAVVLFAGIPLQLVISGLARECLKRVEQNRNRVQQREILRWVEPMPRVIWSIGHVGVLWNLLGTILASFAVFKNHRPRPEFPGPLEGIMAMNTCGTELTEFGVSMGRQNIIAWCNGGGALFSLLGSWTALTLGIVKKNRTLILIGAIESLRELIGALEAVSHRDCAGSGGYRSIDKAGMPIGAVIGVISGVPIAIIALPKLIARVRNR